MTAARAARAARAAAAGLGWATCRLRLCAFCGSWDRLGTRIFKSVRRTFSPRSRKYSIERKQRSEFAHAVAVHDATDPQSFSKRKCMARES